MSEEDKENNNKTDLFAGIMEGDHSLVSEAWKRSDKEKAGNQEIIQNVDQFFKDHNIKGDREATIVREAMKFTTRILAPSIIRLMELLEKLGQDNSDECADFAVSMIALSLIDAEIKSRVKSQGGGKLSGP